MCPSAILAAHSERERVKAAVLGVGRDERTEPATAADLMPTSRTQRAAQLRGNAQSLRQSLEPFDGWPRDARAWARRDRIDALLKRMETDPLTPTTEDPTPLLRLDEELLAWMARECAFYRAYPIVPPAHWTRRPLPTSGPSARRRAQRISVAVQALGARA